MKVLGYPNFDEYQSTLPPVNLDKWVSALKNIHIKTRLGMPENEAVKELTGGWDRLEQRDFKDWKKYYESGDALKYKIAQSYYVNDDTNYFLPNPLNKIPSPIKSINDQIQSAPQEAAEIVNNKPTELSKEDRRKVIEEQRRKLIGRLNSAEKLLTSPQGHMFAGQEFEKLLNAIYELKKHIQTVNKVSLSMDTCVDLIIRQANILRAEGADFAADFMIKLAQNNPGQYNFQLGEVPAGGSKPQGAGNLGNNDLSIPDLGAKPPAGLSGETPQSDGIDGFIENLDAPDLDEKDDNKVEDVELADDDIDLDADSILDTDIDLDGDLVVEAQMMPDAMLPTPQPKARRPEGDLEVEEPALNKHPQVPEDKDVESLVDSAFANITVQDVISKMDDVANIFRNREISRQLAIIDLMLNRLGIAQYFVELNECLQKNYDTNTYSLSRMDNMLSRLKGSTQTDNIDLEGKNKQVAPGAEQLAQSLEQADRKDKERKQMKKDLENQQIQDKLKPEANVEGVPEELPAQQPQIEQTPATPRAPRPQPQAPVV